VLKISFSTVFWGLMSIGVGLFFIAGSWGAFAEYKRVQDYEGRAIGNITDKHFKQGSDGGGSYHVDYWFMSSGGSKISAGSVIAKQQWDMLQKDDTMEVRYDLSNPERNIPMYGGSPSLAYAFFMVLLGGVFVVFGGSRLWYCTRKGKS
jgi:hypothetical protein